MDLVRRCGRRTRKCCAISRPSCSGWPTATPKTSARSSTCPCSSRPWPRLSAPSPASRCLFPSSFPLSTVLRLCVCCCPSGGMTEHQCWLALWRETEYCCCSNHIITMLVLWHSGCSNSNKSLTLVGLFCTYCRSLLHIRTHRQRHCSNSIKPLTLSVTLSLSLTSLTSLPPSIRPLQP